MSTWLSDFSDPVDVENAQSLQRNKPILPPEKGAMAAVGETIKATGEGIAAGAVGVGRAAQFAAGTSVMGISNLTGDSDARTAQVMDNYFESTDKLLQPAVDAYQVDEGVGTVGQVGYGLGRIVLPLMVGGGNPLPLIASETSLAGTDAIEAGATAGQAGGIAAFQGGAVALGFKIAPTLGNTAVKKIASGAAINVAVGGAARTGQYNIASDNEELAKRYDPLNTTSITTDAVIGAAFGAVGAMAARRRALPPEARDAEVDAEVRDHLNGSADGTPATPRDAQNHLDNMDEAEAALLAGREPVIKPVKTVAAEAPRAPIPLKAGYSADVSVMAEAAGVDPVAALVVGHIETAGTFNPKAKNPKSTAHGIFQVIEDSWARLGGKDRGDPKEQIRVGLLHMKEVFGVLKGALGRDPVVHEQYMGHLLGGGGAKRVLTADPSRPLIDVVREYSPKYANDIVNNNGMNGLTVGQAIAKWQAKAAKLERLYSGQARGGSAYTPSGDKVDFVYDVVDVSELTTSHHNDLSVNELFPAEMQPRDRTRAASVSQINDIANGLNPALLGESPTVSDGAPIVGFDGVVESGNARTIGRRVANERGTDAEYRQYLLDNAERLGISRADVEAMSVPMLVRRRTTELDRAEFASRANDQTVAAMSASEKAASDARRLPDANLLQTNADGTLNIGGSMDYVRAFVQSLPETERSMMMDADGRLSQEGKRRIESAIARQAYGDGDLITRLTENLDDNSKTIIGALLKNAPILAQLDALVRAGGRTANTIAKDLAAAAAKFSDLKAAKMTVDDYFAQGQLVDDGLSVGAREALEVMGGNAKSGRAIGEYVQSKIAEVEALGDPRQGGLFDEFAETPEQSAAFGSSLDDVDLPTGMTDADGNPVLMSAREMLEQMQREQALIDEQSTAAQAAASCALRSGT